MQNLGTIDNIYTILSIKENKGVTTIYSVRHNQTQALHLIEVFRDEIPPNLMNILNNLMALNHPYVIRVLGHGNGPIVLNNTPPVNRPYIVYESVTHSILFLYLANNNRFTERQAKLIFKKILEGVKALHNINICHRDLKPENILLDENYNPKIYFFYHSCFNRNDLNDNVGTIRYLAPEIISIRPYDGFKSDIFSLGQLLFNLVTGRHGFKIAKENDPLYSLIRQQNYTEYWNRPEIAQLNLSDSFKNLFVRMVAFNPNERPTIDEILNSEWMQEINNLNAEQMNTLENEVRNELEHREIHINAEEENIIDNEE